MQADTTEVACLWEQANRGSEEMLVQRKKEFHATDPSEVRTCT